MLDQVKNIREDSARAYYWPISGRTNLHTYTSTMADKLLWSDLNQDQDGDSDLAVRGVVAISANGSEYSILATREIILSAGTYRTPVLLEQSEVGDPR